jgi:hypothetical protein
LSGAHGGSGALAAVMRRPAAPSQSQRQRRARTHVRTAGCAGRKERTCCSISSGRAAKASPAAAPAGLVGSLAAGPLGIPSNRQRAGALCGTKSL